MSDKKPEEKPEQSEKKEGSSPAIVPNYLLPQNHLQSLSKKSLRPK